MIPCLYFFDDPSNWKYQIICFLAFINEMVFKIPENLAMPLAFCITRNGCYNVMNRTSLKELTHGLRCVFQVYLSCYKCCWLMWSLLSLSRSATENFWILISERLWMRIKWWWVTGKVMWKWQQQNIRYHKNVMYAWKRPFYLLHAGHMFLHTMGVIASNWTVIGLCSQSARPEHRHRMGECCHSATLLANTGNCSAACDGGAWRSIQGRGVTNSI